jgi:hypothetical protein
MQAKKLFKFIWAFQRNAVKDWHPFVDEVTKVLLCGVIDVNEADGEGAATCRLDLALKHEVLLEKDTGGGSLAMIMQIATCSVLETEQPMRIAQVSYQNFRIDHFCWRRQPSRLKYLQLQ